MKSKAITPHQKLAVFLHKKFRRSDEGWAYEVELVVIGKETTIIRGVETIKEIWSTYSDDDDNIHDWEGYSHKYYLNIAQSLVEELKNLELL